MGYYYRDCSYKEDSNKKCFEGKYDSKIIYYQINYNING